MLGKPQLHTNGVWSSSMRTNTERRLPLCLHTMGGVVPAPKETTQRGVFLCAAWLPKRRQPGNSRQRNTYSAIRIGVEQRQVSNSPAPCPNVCPRSHLQEVAWIRSAKIECVSTFTLARSRVDKISKDRMCGHQILHLEHELDKPSRRRQRQARPSPRPSPA